MLHLAKVGQQLPRQLEKLLKPVLQAGVVQKRDISRQNAGDLRVDIVAALLQFGDSHLGIGLASLAHLPQQLEQGQQAGFRADKGTFGQALQPGHGLFRRGSQIKMRFVRPWRIEFPQPPLVVFSPIIEVALGGSGKGFGPQQLP